MLDTGKMSSTVLFGDRQVDAGRLAEVCRRFGVLELSLFGSAVRGELRAESDVDVLVTFDPAARVGIVKFETLVEELEGLVGRMVDLVTKRGLKPWVRAEVLREARVVFVAGGGGERDGDGMMRFDEGEGGAGGVSAS
jgi:predicted nucleotidyltransferase